MLIRLFHLYIRHQIDSYMNTTNQAAQNKASTDDAIRAKPAASVEPASARLRDLVFQHEGLNFLLTNRIPRGLATRFMGWFSKIEQPWIRDLSIAAWRLFADLDLSDAEKNHFTSLHDCFTRRLKPDARWIDSAPDALTAPCDGIVGACGSVEGTTVFQAKGFPYSLIDLLGSAALAEKYRDGCYVTLRLTSSMYHRFHAPVDCHVNHVTYISGDTWNVNPIALKRVERLFCKNERAVIQATLKDNAHSIALVPVAAILVASIQLNFLNVRLHIKYRGPNEIACDVAYGKGAEMGYFEHGSTIIVFVPKGFVLCNEIEPGSHIRMGERLLHIPA
jgi:phosphatidylserine decarboxylase